MMKNLARACLRVVMLTIPVVIAACYGVGARFTRNGKVIDSQTHLGVEDIRVTCVEANGTVSASASSYGSGGDFTLFYDIEQNDAGVGRYQNKTVPFPASSDITIQVDKVTAP